MSNREQISRAQQFVTELNQGNLESIRQFVAADFFAYSPAADEPSATDIYYDLISDLKAAFPNFSLALENVKTEGDTLVGRLRLSGSHDGALWGAPASGVSVTWDVDVALRSINDRFAVKLENLATPDILGVLRQVEVIPPPEDMDKPPKHPVSLPENLLKILFTGQVADKPCSHIADIQVTEPSVDVCQECVALGDEWPALRMCLICGYVGCCDMAKNKHMKAHFEQTGHPIFRSIHMDEGWIWCYPDSAFYSQRILDNYR